MTLVPLRRAEGSVIRRFLTRGVNPSATAYAENHFPFADIA